METLRLMVCRAGEFKFRKPKNTSRKSLLHSVMVIDNGDDNGDENGDVGVLTIHTVPTTQHGPLHVP